MMATATVRAETELAAMATERLEAEITELAGHLAAASCRLLLMIAEMDRRGSWASWGAKSCAHWLNWQIGLEIGAAREKVRVAHAIGTLPEIRDAFSRGLLSYSKVRALTRVATAETEHDLLGLARDASTAQLERILRAYRRAMPADADAAVRAYHNRSLTWRSTEDGDLVVEVRLPPEQGAALKAAVEAHLEPYDVSGETSIAQRRADALTAIVDAATTAGASEGQATVVSNVVVHADLDLLCGDTDTGACHVEAGDRLALETLRRLACDCAVDLVVEHDGEVLDVGRRTRTIPPAMRRAVLARDGHCVWPGCADRIIDVHHLEHWTEGGHTKLSNLGGLCKAHHWHAHEGGFDIERLADATLRVRRPDGREVKAPAPAVEGSCDDLVHSNTDLDVTADAITPRHPEARIDFDYVVSVHTDSHRRRCV